MLRVSCLLALISVLVWSTCSSAKQRLTAAEAKAHVGEQATVCGRVAGFHQATHIEDDPTFINLDKPYPNQIFAILIWVYDLPKFGNLEKDYLGKQVCVTGKIKILGKVPEIVAHDPAVIKLQ